VQGARPRMGRVQPFNRDDAGRKTGRGSSLHGSPSHLEVLAQAVAAADRAQAGEEHRGQSLMCDPNEDFSSLPAGRLSSRLLGRLVDCTRPLA
jgi:hypothetical protein